MQAGKGWQCRCAPLQWNRSGGPEQDTVQAGSGWQFEAHLGNGRGQEGRTGAQGRPPWGREAEIRSDTHMSTSMLGMAHAGLAKHCAGGLGIRHARLSRTCRKARAPVLSTTMRMALVCGCPGPGVYVCVCVCVYARLCTCVRVMALVCRRASPKQ